MTESANNPELRTWRVTFVLDDISHETVTRFFEAGLEAGGEMTGFELEGSVEPYERPSAEESVKFLLDYMANVAAKA